jgi:hypothetical protein
VINPHALAAGGRRATEVVLAACRDDDDFEEKLKASMVGGEKQVTFLLALASIPCIAATSIKEAAGQPFDFQDWFRFDLPTDDDHEPVTVAVRMAEAMSRNDPQSVDLLYEHADQLKVLAKLIELARFTAEQAIEETGLPMTATEFFEDSVRKANSWFGSPN